MRSDRAAWRDAYRLSAKREDQSFPHCAHSICTRDPLRLHRIPQFLRRAFDDFKQLNFAGDGETEQLLEKARTELLSRSAEDYRDNTSARVKLQQGIRQLADNALALAKQDSTEIVSSFGQLGVRKFQLAA